MVSFSTIRLFLWLIPISWLLTDCQTDLTVQKDPTFVTLAGDYKITGTASYTINKAVSSFPLSGTLSVVADDSATTFQFREKTGSTELDYLATFVGETFTVEPVQECTVIKNARYYGKQSGGGRMIPGRIEMDRFATTNSVSLQSLSGESIVYNMSIQKRVHFVATK